MLQWSLRVFKIIKSRQGFILLLSQTSFSFLLQSTLTLESFSRTVISSVIIRRTLGIDQLTSFRAWCVAWDILSPFIGSTDGLVYKVTTIYLYRFMSSVRPFAPRVAPLHCSTSLSPRSPLWVGGVVLCLCNNKDCTTTIRKLCVWLS